MTRRRVFNAPHGGVVGCSGIALYAAFELGRLWGSWWPLLASGLLLTFFVVTAMTRDWRRRRRWWRELAAWQAWRRGG